MTDKHLSSQFDSDLVALSARLMELGGLVEAQLRQAVHALLATQAEAARQVIAGEPRVNRLELEIDRELASIIGRRQPAARDLRLLLAVARVTANLERAGDEAERIARMAVSLASQDTGGPLLLAGELRQAAQFASNQLRLALDAFARLDWRAALVILRGDDQLDAEFGAITRQLVAAMTDDARTIAAGLDLLSVAKAIERIGDHATNIAESVIYVVRGADVRHRPLDEIEAALG